MGPTKLEVDLPRLIVWADECVRNFAAKNMELVMFILPSNEESAFLNRLMTTPLPKDSELRLDKTSKGVKLYLCGIQVMFTNKLREGAVRFRLQSKAYVDSIKAGE